MAVSLGDIVVHFLADTTELVAGVEESKGLLGNFGGIAAGVGIAAGAAMVGIGVESVKMAGEFQQSLTQLVTGAGESQKNLGMVGDGIKQISVESATSTKALTNGMYMIESASFHGAAGLDVLKASAEGARAGNANLATAASAVTTMMVDYSNKHYTATEAMNALIATEQVGKTHLEDLGRSMGAVLPLASSLGISFPQVAGGIAVMTNAGMTAQHASQNLANAMRSLSAPNSVAVNSMQAVGLSAQQLKDRLSTQGLSGAIQLVEEHVGKKFPAGSVEAVQAFKNIMGGATGYNVALMLGGDHMKTYEANIKSIGAALGKNAKDVEGFALVQQNFSFQLDRAKMAGNALMLTLGQALLPVLTNLLEQVTPMIVRFTDWESKTHGVENVLSTVGGILQNTVVPFVGQLTETISTVVNRIIEWEHNTHTIETAINGLKDAVDFVNTTIKNGKTVVDDIKKGFENWKPTIEGVSTILAVFFTPAIIKAGAEAVISGAKLAASFIANIVKTGVEAALAGPKLAISFVAKVVDAGVEGWTSAGKLAVFIGNIIKTGVEAVVAGAKVAASFVASIVKAGAEAVVAGAKIAASFIANIVKAGVEAVVTGAKMLASLVPALISVAGEAMVAAVTAIPTLVAGFLTWAASAGAAAIATIAATWPILVIIGAIALLAVGIYLLVTHWKEVTSFLTTTWANVSSWVIRTFTNIKNGISDWISHAWTTLSDWFGQLGKWFGDLPSKALQWGKDLIQGFIDGINNMVGSVGSAVSNVAGTVAQFLGFQSPTELGPGRELDTWGVNLAKGFAQSLQRGIPQIQAAVNLASAPLAVMGLPATTTSAPSQVIATTAPARAQQVQLVLEIDGQQISSLIAPHLDRHVRLKFGPRGRG